MVKEIIDKILKKVDIKINGNKPYDIQVHNPKLYRRILAEGTLGLGEAYIDGWWDVKELDQFFAKILETNIHQEIKDPKLLITAIQAKLFNQQSKKKSKRVAEQHYNLGNDFYKDMLDSEYMQYTCAYFKNTKSLAKAQEQKLDLICKKLQLKKGMTVLELGCGWGGFAKFATKKYGVHVTAHNISTEQIKYAKENCKKAHFKLQDYREAKGKYDRVVSIGMMEHVGPKNYNNFMKLIAKCLKKDGLALVHTIGNRKPLREGHLDPWIAKYIFPGGHLPSLSQIIKASEKHFVTEDVQNIGANYDKTLMAWFENFNKNWHKHEKELGPRFYRMWKYYLLSCAGSFRARNIHLFQVVFSKGLKKGIIVER